MTDSRGTLFREAFFNGNGVAKKLIVALVLFSSIVTAVITAFELHAGYRRDMAQIDRSIDFIGKSYAPSLTDSVWVADRQQVQTQLDGLLRLPDIEFLGISVDGRQRWSAGERVSARTVGAEVPLVREHRGQMVTIGTVVIVASVDRVLGRVWQQLLAVLLGNAVKTVLVAGFMLLVFQYLVTRHLTRITAFVRAIDPQAPLGGHLKLDRTEGGPWRPDILDALSGSINALSSSLHGAHEELKRSEQRLRALTLEAAAYIYEIDREGLILFANRTYRGVTRDQVEGTRLTDWFTQDLRPRVSDLLERAFVERQPQRFEYKLPDPTGIVRTYSTTLSPVVREGDISSVALTALDVSELKDAQAHIHELNQGLEQRVRERTAELEQASRRAESASRAKSEFLSRMSHELRTPMNAILGFAQIIEMSNPTDRQRGWAAEIQRAGDHLMQMIEDLLDLARIEVGKIQIRFESVAIAELIGEAAAMIQPLLTARRLSLLIDNSAAPGLSVCADRLRLRQVLVNLLSNAAKYNREGGTVTVHWRQHGARWRVSVIDTGHGLTPEQLDRLFVPFERLGAERGTVEGTGIGLALSKQLAELMGAAMGATSQAGTGSEFWIELDAASSTARATASLAQAAPLETHPMRLLYVEDNAPNRALLSEFFATRANVQFLCADSGMAGVELARRERPDVILLDIHLPDIDGYEVLRRLRADMRLNSIPVIALSADAMPHDIQEGLKAGFDRYLPKPLDLNRLLVTLDEFGRNASTGQR